MAHSFAVNAQLTVKGPPNLRPLISQIKAGLSNVNANINLKLTPAAVTNIGNLNARLVTLNKNFIAIQSSGKGANAILQQLATTFNSMNASATVVAASLGKINASVNQVQKSTKSASASVSGFGELVGVSAKKFLAFSLAASAIAGFVFSIQNGFRDAVKFQHQLVKLAQVGGDSASVIKGIAAEVTKLSTTLGVSSQGLIETTVTLRQAGLTATETKKALEGLAKTELAPTFDDIKKTTEGAIAIMAQFKIKSKDLEGALGSINTVSAKYAVESGDLIEAVRRSGGAFKAAGGDLNQFLALFTSVRATTRESAESIATGFRTIFARLQQPGTINSLKQIGVTLDDMNGQFVGPYEAVKRLSEALKNIPTSDTRFAKVVEQIGGIRQVSKVIPLLKEFTMSQQAYNDALAGQNSLNKDAITAQQSLTVRITRLKEEFLDLFRVIGENSMVQAFIGSALSLASALIKITRALEPLIPLLTVFAAVKLGRGVAGFAAGVTGGLTKGIKLAKGGSVPGSGNGDTVPAMLTPGEFVIKKSAAQAIGHDTLKTWNKYADGGIVLPKTEHIGQIALKGKPEKNNWGDGISLSRSKTTKEKAETVLGRYQKTHPEIAPYIDDIINSSTLRAPVDTYTLDKDRTDKVFHQEMAGPIYDTINNQINKYRLGKTSFKYDVTKDKSFTDNLKGGLFEAFLSAQTGLSASGGTASFDFDIYGKKVGAFAKLLEQQPFRPGYMDAKATRQSPGAIVKKAADFGLFNNKITAPALIKDADYANRMSTINDNIDNTGSGKDKDGKANLRRNSQLMASIFSTKRAAGGPINGGTDTVPAMLTPGEFVINKESAMAIGHGNLDKVNKVSKFAKGGPVGFAAGGSVPGIGLVPPELLSNFKKIGIEIDKIDLSKFIKAIRYVDDFSHFANKFPAGTKNIKGLFNTQTKEIELKRGLNPTDEMATAMHELTHAFDAAMGPKSGGSPFASHVEGTAFNKAAKLAAATQPEGMLENYRKRMPGRDLSHEQLAFGAGAYVKAKANGTIGAPKGPFDDGDNAHEDFFNFFENKILGKIAKAHPATMATGGQHQLVAADEPYRPSYFGPPPLKNSTIDDELKRRGQAGAFNKARSEMFNDVFNQPPGGGPPNGPNGPNGPDDPNDQSVTLPNRKRFGSSRFSGIKCRLSSISTIGALAAPLIAENLLGSAEKPGAFGKTGAAIGSTVGGGVQAGAAAALVTKNPYIIVGAAALGAATSLENFNKEIKAIEFTKLSEEFSNAVTKLKTEGDKKNLTFKTGAIKSTVNETAFSDIGITDRVKIGASSLMSGDFSGLFNDAYGGGGSKNSKALTDFQNDRQQQAKDQADPALESVLNQFKELANANPGKSMDELEKLNPELTKAKFALATFDTEAVRATTIAINNAQKQVKAQQDLDLSLLKLSISADELSTKLSIGADTAEKNLARNAIGRGGKVSAGVDNFNIGSLGAEGKELNNFAKNGGLLDRAKLALTESLKSVKGGSLGKDSIQKQIFDNLSKVQGFDEKDPTSKIIADGIRATLEGEEGDKLINAARGGNPQAFTDKALEGGYKAKAPIDKANEELAKALQMFAQNSIAIAEQQDIFMGEQEKIAQFRIGAEKDRATTLLKNNDVNFVRGGRVITPEDQMNEVNSRVANASFTASQGRFGISEVDAANPVAIAAKIKGEQGNLSGLVSQQRSLVESNAPAASIKPFSDKIVESTSRINNYQQALKNLSTSTTVLEAAQGKLNTALEKEAADMTGRKKVGEERAFGSRGDIVKSMMADQLVGVAASQGHLENFSDEQRAMTFSRLQETAGVQRDNGFTGQQIIDFISNKYAPQTNIPSSVAATPNGMRMVSNDVLGEQANVSAIQGRMGAAGDALQSIIKPEIMQQVNEQAQEFGNMLKNAQLPMGEFFDMIKNGVAGAKGKNAPTFAAGGMAKGTDTIPAMLSPGEFVVNAQSAAVNKNLLHQINSNKTQYAADGGSIGWSPFGDDEEAKRLRQERTRAERAREIAKRVARREKLGLPEYVPVSKRPIDSSPANAFNDPQAAQMRGEQLTRDTNIQRRNMAAQNIANGGNRNGMAAIAMNRGQGQAPGAAPGMNMADAGKQFIDNTRPFVDALNSFPRELVIKRDGTVNVVINGVEAMAKIKGDLEVYVYDKIIEAVKMEVPKVVKGMPG